MWDGAYLFRELYKPQKPFSSCLKECNTVILCICTCAYTESVCMSQCVYWRSDWWSMSHDCHVFYWLNTGMLGGSLQWFVRSAEFVQSANQRTKGQVSKHDALVCCSCWSCFLCVCVYLLFNCCCPFSLHFKTHLLRSAVCRFTVHCITHFGWMHKRYCICWLLFYM